MPVWEARAREWLTLSFMLTFSSLAEKYSWKLFTARSLGLRQSEKLFWCVWIEKSRFRWVSIMWIFQIQFTLKLVEFRPRLMQSTVWILIFLQFSVRKTFACCFVEWRKTIIAPQIWEPTAKTLNFHLVTKSLRRQLNVQSLEQLIHRT